MQLSVQGDPALIPALARAPCECLVTVDSEVSCCEGEGTEECGVGGGRRGDVDAASSSDVTGTDEEDDVRAVVLAVWSISGQ